MSPTFLLPKQAAVLGLCARIQYATLDHLRQAGVYVTKSDSTARGHLRDLVARKYLSESHYGVEAGAGRLPVLYGLAPKGVRYLAESEDYPPDRIKASASNKNQPHEKRAPADYRHRVGLIDTVLSLLLCLDGAGLREDLLELYFRRHGMHAPRRTAIELGREGRLEPDAILSFHNGERARLFLVEFYEDSANAERIRRSVLRHGVALATGAPTTATGAGVGHRTLLCFRYPHAARSAMDFVATSGALEGVAGRFMFAVRDAAVADAFGCWTDCRGNPVPFL